MPIRALIVFAIVSPTLLAQPATAPVNPASRPRNVSERVTINPALRQQTLDRVREKLALTDEDWAKLKPKIERVMDAKRNTSSAAGVAFNTPIMVGGAVIGSTTRPTTGASAPGNSTPANAMQAMREAVEDKNLTEEEIAKKLEAFRDAREKARVELEEAQKALKEAITPRQEALMVTMGVLD